MKTMARLALVGVSMSLMLTTVSCSNKPEIHEETTENTVEVTERGFNNCGNSVSQTMKEETSYTRSHRAYWEVGGTTGVGGEIPVSFLSKFNIDLSMSAKYGQSDEDVMTQKRTFDVDVPPDMKKQYAFFWNITHRKGYILTEGKRITFDYPEKMEFLGLVTDELPCNVFIISDVLLAEIPGMPTPTPNPEIYSYDSSWVNVNPRMGEITRIDMTKDGIYLLLDVSLDCSAGGQCNLPGRQIFFAGSPIQVTYTSSYKTTDLELSIINNGRLYVKATDHYTKTPFGVYIPDLIKEYYLEKQ